MRFDGIIFDVDGTLWDSCESVRESWQLSLRRRYGSSDSPSLEQIRSIMGLTPDEIIHGLLSRFGERAGEVFDALAKDECVYLTAHGAEIYPGVVETLRELAQTRRLFIVSNCQDGYIESFLHTGGVAGCIESFSCAGVTGLEKAETLRLLMREHALERAVYVGDTLSDERAARANGCAFIHAAYGFGTAERPDAVLSAFSALPRTLAALEEV